MNPTDLEQLIRRRRTSMLVTDEAVPHELVEQIQAAVEHVTEPSRR